MATIELPQCDTQFPLTDVVLSYVDYGKILATTKNWEKLFRSVTSDFHKQLRFNWIVNETGSYARFSPLGYPYALSLNSQHNPILDLSARTTIASFSDIVDARALELLAKADKFIRVYLFWSGGIDSTVILSSLIKNWNTSQLQQLTVVLNEFSIAENPTMYAKFIHGKIDQVSTDDFFSEKIKFSTDHLYITGDVGDPIAGHSSIDFFDNLYPGVYSKSWKSQQDTLIQYFTINSNSTEASTGAFDTVVKSLTDNKIEVDTVYDFLWWIAFNWGYDKVVYHFPWKYAQLPDTVPLKKFMHENYFSFFNTIAFQQWSLSAVGSNLKIQQSIKTNKYSFKKYIFDVDGDLDYFLFKSREPSLTKNIQESKTHWLLAIDLEFNAYVRPSTIYY